LSHPDPADPALGSGGPVALAFTTFAFAAGAVSLCGTPGAGRLVWGLKGFEF